MLNTLTLHTRILLGIILAAGVVAFAVAHEKLTFANQPIFELSRTTSWQASKNLIYYGSSGPVVETLNSHALWKKFVLSFSLANPLTAGVVYDIRSEGWYRFFMFNRPQRTLIAGQNINGAIRIDRSWPLELPAGEDLVLPLTLEVDAAQAVLRLAGKPLASFEAAIKVPARFGLYTEQATVRNNVFLNILVTGELADGRAVSLGPESYQDFDRGKPLARLWTVPGIGAVILLYVLAILFLVVLKNSGPGAIAVGGNHPGRALDMAGLILYALAGAVVFVKAWQLGHKVAFYPAYWQTMPALLCVMSMDILLLGLSWFYARRFIRLSPLLVFVVLPVFLYGVHIINLNLLHWPDPWFLRGVLGLLALPILFISKEQVAELKNIAGSIFKVNRYNGLVLLWLVYVSLYFLEYNFRMPRPLFGDEANLWFAAARNMIHNGVLEAHLAGYPAGGYHPFGIPFLTAIPGLLWGSGDESLIFFMPLFNIIVFTVFLLRLRQQPGLFLFFYAASFVVCDYAGLIGALLFRLVYGEGWSGLYFLVMGAEIIRLSRNGKITDWRCWLGLGMAAGLTLLTKRPVYYWGAIFLLTAAVCYFRTGCSLRLLRNFLAGVAVFFLPVGAWGWLAHQHGIGSAVSVTGTMFGPGSWHFNLGILDWRAMMAWSYVSPLAGYYLLGALVLCLAAWRRSASVHLFPPLTLLIFVTGYYVFGFQSDWTSSSVRYYMPAALLILYLAGLALEDWLQRAAGRAPKAAVFLYGVAGLAIISGMVIL
ncbi:MAG: hypothetical protein HQL20_00115 [Candidatus Omnitrophica bacterium]|nr:hypothetical protein [Candidatus Omnitrophota bacterium]